MLNKKDIKISLNINEIYVEMIDYLVKHKNKESLSVYRKTNLLRDLIYKEFIEVNRQTFNDLAVDINNPYEVIKASTDLELINIKNI